MPYKFLAFFVLIYSSSLVLCTCSRNFIYEYIRGKNISYNENGKLKYILNNPIGET